MYWKKFTLIIFATGLTTGLYAQNPNGIIDGIEEMVERREYMIPMHDGVNLATDVYRPVLQDNLAFDNITVNLPIGGSLVIPRLKIANKGIQYMVYPNQANPYQLPVIFTRTPYNKKSPEQGQVEAIMGYAGIIQDMRGRYNSQGVYLPMYSDSWPKSGYINVGHPLDTTQNKAANEHQDGYESVKYITDQLRYDANGDSIIDQNDPLLCNGDIGMFGASALGNTQYQAAAVKKVNTNERGLKCLVPVVASAEFYHSTGTHNGVYRERIIDGWLRGQVERYGEYQSSEIDGSVFNNIHSLGDYGPNISFPKQAAELAIDFWTVMNQAHYPNSDFRAVMDMSHAPIDANGNHVKTGTISRYTNLELPIYNLTGWWDIFVDGQIQTWQNLTKHLSPENRRYQKIVIGPWAHQTIGSRATGDMRQTPDGKDYRYPENIGDVIGVPLDDLSATNIGGISKSEIIDWYRSFLGSPKVVFPPLNEWQYLGNVFGSNVYVKVPADTLKMNFEDFFNFINGTAPLKDLPVSFKGIALVDSNTVNKITIPATGQSLLGDNSGAQLKPAGSVEWDATKPNGIRPVRFYVVGPVNDGIPENSKAGNYWYAADTFPLPNLQRQKLYLHADGSINDKAPTEHEGALSYLADPNNPVITHGGPNMIVETPDIPNVNKRDSQGQMNLADPLYSVFTNQRPKVEFKGDSISDILHFVSPELLDTFSIAGFPNATIYAKSTPQSTIMADSTNCDFIVRVADVYPDGREMYVFEGAINARARDYAPSWADGVENVNLPWSNIESGKMYEYRFRMLPIAYTFGKGHKIKVLISSSSYPRYQSCPNVPLNPGEFYRRRPYEDKSYNYKGVDLYPRKALQTLEISDVYAANIEFPLLGKKLAVSRPEAQATPKANIIMYPNPAEEVVSFAAEKNGPYQLTVYNTLGATVQTATFTNTHTLDVSHFPRGLYSVQIADKQGQPLLAKKLILR